MRNLILITLAVFTLSQPLFSQGGMTLYNMTYIPQASYLNPANTPQTNFYISLPVISGVGVGLNNNFFSLKDVGVDLNAKWDKAYGDSLLSSFAQVAQSSNSLGLRGGVDLLGFGLRSDKHYISFYIREEMQANLDFPDELFRFLNDYQRDVVGLNTPYLMSGSRFSVSQYRPITLQYAYDVSPMLTLGGKVSYISGIYTLDASNDTLIAVGDGEGPDDYEIIGRMNVLTGGFIEADTANIRNVFTNPQNSGFSVGFGGKLTTLEDRLDISFSAVNLGRIFWNQKVGLTELTDESFSSADSLGQIFDTLFRVNEKANFSFRQNLIPDFFLGANYYFTQNLSLGGLVRVQPVYETIHSSFGLFFNARVGKWLGFSSGYMYADQSHNIPFGLTIQPGPFQLYIVTDNALGFVAPGSSRHAHLNVGFNLTFGKTTRHWPDMASDQDMNNLTGASQPEPAEEEGDEYDVEDDEDVDYYEMFLESLGEEEQDTIVPPAGEAPLYKDDETAVTTYTVTSPLMLHRGPSGTTTVLDTIRTNTVITVLQKRLPDWWYVEYGLKSGWIQPRNIRPALELPDSVQEAPAVSEPIKHFSPQAYIMLDQTAMRTEPLDGSKELHRLQKWDEVLVLEKTNSSWWKIRHDDFVGYVKSAMLNPRPDNYIRPEQRPTTVRPAPTSEPQKSMGVFTITESTSLRADATHESSALMRLRKGTKVTLLEKTNALWWKVESKGVIGYAKAANLTAE